MRTAAVSSSSSSSAPTVAMAASKKPNKKGSDQAPPRITSNVKKNLQILRLWKELQKQKSSTPRPATSYRKKKAVKEDIPEDMELYKDPTSNLYYTNQGLDTAVPVLLVDGYNVCGYWAKLKKHFMKGRLDIARQKLIDELISFSVIKEVKVVVVFDAQMSGLPTHKESFAGIDVIFSAETCADAWIEKEVVALKVDGCPKVWVVTSDIFQQQAAHGAGAFVWSCKALVSEIKASQREFEQILDEYSARWKGGIMSRITCGVSAVCITNIAINLKIVPPGEVRSSFLTKHRGHMLHLVDGGGSSIVGDFVNRGKAAQISQGH